MAEAEKIVYIATHAEEDPFKATIPFVMANAAQAMDVEAVVVLQGTSVFLAMKGYAEHVFAPNFPPLKQLMDSFLEAGGKLMVCVPCIKERKIEESDLIAGATLTAAGALTEQILGAKATVVY